MKVFSPPREIGVYDPGLRTIHWLMAALIFIGLALGVWATLLPRGESRSEVLFFHKSIGATVFGLVVLRIIWRLAAGAPDYAEPLGKLIRAGSRAGHLALYALMIAMPVSGYLRLVGKDKSLAETTAWAHYVFVFAWTIAFVLAAHLGAVVWHAAIKRDMILTRMWPRYRPTTKIQPR